jgi:hypothetical protein
LPFLIGMGEQAPNVVDHAASPFIIAIAPSKRPQRVNSAGGCVGRINATVS